MENKEKNFISAVVYVNNDEKRIKNFLEKINSVLNNNFLKYEIICVNDCSNDNSYEEIKKWQDGKELKNASITIVNMSFYQGKELAMNAGVDLSIGDFVFEFDSVMIDYNPNTIIDVYKKSLEGYDIVNASSNKKRYKTSILFYKIFNKFSNNQYKIGTDTFRILSRRAINRIHSMNKTIPYRKAIYGSCGLKMTTLHYKSEEKSNNRLSKRQRKERSKNAIDALILFTDISYKFSITMSLIMILITIAVAIYTICIFISSNPIRGWTTTMLFLSFGLFGIFSMLTIVIKYLSIIVDLIFKKSKYMVESIEKIN